MHQGIDWSNITSIPLVRKEDWLFKVSVLNGTIMIVGYNPLFQWSHIRFFSSEDEAKNWVEYLMLQSKHMMKDEE